MDQKNGRLGQGIVVALKAEAVNPSERNTDLGWTQVESNGCRPGHRRSEQEHLALWVVNCDDGSGVCDGGDKGRFRKPSDRVSKSPSDRRRSIARCDRVLRIERKNSVDRGFEQEIDLISSSWRSAANRCGLAYRGRISKLLPKKCVASQYVISSGSILNVIHYAAV